MKKSFEYPAVILLQLVISNAYAWGGLVSQQIKGNARYCTYSDGGVLTVGSTELCPISNSKQSKHMGSPTIEIENRNIGFGTLKDQEIRGSSRYCMYTDGSVHTVGSTDLCPVSSK